MERGSFASQLITNPSMGGEATPKEGQVFTQTQNGADGPFLLLSGYAAANTSPNRGYLWWPSSKSRHELTPMAAEEIRRRIHWLVANFGFARRLVRGMAKLIGTLTPQPDTEDEDWNDLVFENFLERAGSEEIFDVAGKFDFWGNLFQMDVDRFKDGDVLTVPVAPADWQGVQFMTYEGSQITDEGQLFRSGYNTQGRGRRGTPEFLDGVKTDRFGKHTHYRVQDGVDPNRYHVIPARYAYYYANLENRHMVRGLSVLAHAVMNMVDVVETRSYTKKRLKEHATIGTVVEQDPSVMINDGPAGFGGQIITTTVPMPDGSEKDVNWKLVFGGGEIPNLAPGQRVKVVADDRPTPNNMEFELSLLKDCTWGVDLPYEALCDIAQVRGPGIRYIMGEIRRWVSNQLLYKAKFARWQYSLHVANEIEAGRLPRPKEIPGKPHWWRAVQFVGQPDITIDEGRSGNLCLVNLESGLTTWAEEWGAKGKYWKRAIRQRVREVQFAKAACAEAGLDLKEVFPKLAGGGQPLAKPGDEPREPEPEDPEDEKRKARK